LSPFNGPLQKQNSISNLQDRNRERMAEPIPCTLSSSDMELQNPHILVPEMNIHAL